VKLGPTCAKANAGFARKASLARRAGGSRKFSAAPMTDCPWLLLHRFSLEKNNDDYDLDDQQNDANRTADSVSEPKLAGILFSP
jgi:hypothetical protein